MKAIELDIPYNHGKMLFAEVLPVCELTDFSIKKGSFPTYPTDKGYDIIIVDWIICNGYFFSEKEIDFILKYCKEHEDTLIEDPSELHQCLLYDPEDYE